MNQQLYYDGFNGSNIYMPRTLEGILHCVPIEALTVNLLAEIPNYRIAGLSELSELERAELNIWRIMGVLPSFEAILTQALSLRFENLFNGVQNII